MIRVRVLTSFSQEGYEAYGKRFINEFHKNWGLPLTVISEMRERPLELDQENDRFYRLDTSALDRLAMRPEYAKGSEMQRAKIHKFGAKALAVYHALQVSDWKGWLLWIDADVTFQGGCPFPTWFDELLPKRAHVSCLWRPRRDVETGFVGYKVQEDPARELIRNVGKMYLNGTIFELGDWGDGEAFKFQLYKSVQAHRVYNIAHDLKCTHVWPHTPLAKHLTHHKGVRRKHAAYGVLDKKHPSKLTP